MHEAVAHMVSPVFGFFDTLDDVFLRNTKNESRGERKYLSKESRTNEF